MIFEGHHAEIMSAIEATPQSDWKADPSEGGFEFRTATSRGWTIRIGYGQCAGVGMQDGTATQPPGMIFHLTAELARAARLQATGECCIRGMAGEHALLSCRAATT